MDPGGIRLRLAMQRGFLDPRTKFVLLILIAVFCLGGAGGARLALFRLLLSMLPYGLSFLEGLRSTGREIQMNQMEPGTDISGISGGEKRMVPAIIRLGLLILSYLYLTVLYNPIEHSGGTARVLSFLLLFAANVFARLFPSLEMGDYTIRTTSVSEFTAAMRRLRLPDTIIIPMSVMFRFFPTIRENAGAVREAMAMRGVRLANPVKYLEYCLVPLVECTAKLGDDLSASALMRGLGAPVKRTEIRRIGFRRQDAGTLGVVAAFLVLSLA